ncbi:DEAD-box ATP-dependent RNA helicase 17-like [Dorcoceras hygrometricum]|uniref:ATP-dependent RNA helicase n=1 Tax=Dorcoceras hygrometricum TaxID=472368 RepID=A0A2Z7AB54_9LAMI|nr:DEAD-box ATP-dependent RNA helicase 17-like [Dorcoceras hygrometricum]
MMAGKSGGRKVKVGDNSDSEVFASCSFSSLGLHPTLCEQLKERLGFEVPTQVQAKAIPVVLSGRHVLVNAATGTGKTVAYLAPIIHHLQNLDRRIQRSDGTFGVSILVATPGRLLDHLKNTSSFLHSKLQWVIFDEADRILELGYGKEIEDILDYLGTRQHALVGKGNSAFSPEVKKQNLLLSATLNEKVNHLAKISLENPVMIGLDDKILQTLNHNHAVSQESDMSGRLEVSTCVLHGTSDEEYKLPVQLSQRYMKVPCGSRLVVLLSILKNLFEKEASQKVVVFFSTCDAVDFHFSLFSEFQWPPVSQSEAEVRQMFLRCKTLRLHGNMKHEDRKTTFQTFKTEKSALLLSTDVSARGLDFPKVRCIIQYDSPGEATEYVHRVGRTARLGEKGDSLLFLQPVELDYLKDLEKHGVMLTEYSLLKLLGTVPLYNLKHQVKKFVSVDMHPWLLTLQRALESYISSEPRMKKLAQDAFCAWVRAYTAHRGELKRIFMVKKLHLGHIAKSFALKDQPSLVNKSIQKQIKKRKRDEKQRGNSRKKRVITKS